MSAWKAGPPMDIVGRTSPPAPAAVSSKTCGRGAVMADLVVVSMVSAAFFMSVIADKHLRKCVAKSVASFIMAVLRTLEVG